MIDEYDSPFGPGVYSAFVLSDDGMWEQPSFRLNACYDANQVRNALCTKYDGFIVYGLCEDPDADPDSIESISEYL